MLPWRKSVMGELEGDATPTHAIPTQSSLPSRYALSVEAAKCLIRRRSRFKSHLGEALVADPGMDMLLDLLIHQDGPTPVAVNQAQLASGVPATTALRWIKVIEQEGLIERYPDPRDQRRIYLRLTPMGLEKMLRVLDP
jgi:DNA-binding MarR family transcriptional regulator